MRSGAFRAASSSVTTVVIRSSATWNLGISNNEFHLYAPESDLRIPLILPMYQQYRMIHHLLTLGFLTIQIHQRRTPPRKALASHLRNQPRPIIRHFASSGSVRSVPSFDHPKISRDTWRCGIRPPVGEFVPMNRRASHVRGWK
jgi:hypothetical protein